MTQITDGMIRAILILSLFLSLMGLFNILFIGAQIENPDDFTLNEILAQSWQIFTQPELLILNIILFTVGLIVSLFVIRELLPI